MALRNNQSLLTVLPCRLSSLLGSTAVFVVLHLCASLAISAEFSEAQKLYFAGEYKACAGVANAEVERGVWNEKWPALLLECQLTLGEYEKAEAIYEVAKARFKNSIALRMIGHRVKNFVGKPEEAGLQYAEIVELVQRAPWRYSSSSDRVILGRFLLDSGEDAREVLELAYDRARKSNPKLADIYIATAELALSKHDYAEAAKSLKTAVELQPDNPYVHLLLGKTWESSDPGKAAASVDKALELNRDHLPSLLFQADHFIDGEKFDAARDTLDKVLKINKRLPEAHAYLAVISHLQGDEENEKKSRDKALEPWPTNAAVDYLIGRKLSRNYRFAEGAAYQRRALEFDPNLLVAKLQLSQDLLRLGEEEEGWQLADEVHEKDGYNVVAYNAVTLRDAMRNFATIETDRFILRMDARESRIYGQQVLDLLNEAHDFFCDKYEVTIDGPVIVEIFPQQKDFAIRTFGLPGGAGYLGVCFGRVVTANSPSSQGERPANWRSVLWHEFCHVVTLEKTRNKMPRWVSEGISTYEEQEKNDGWGERLNTAYRLMIASDEELRPLSQLSASFLNPKSPQHLQFAYFESSLAIRFLIERHGLPTLKRVLTDLGVGMSVNESLGRYVGSLEKLDQDFAEYARRFVDRIGPDVDWQYHEEVDSFDLSQTKAWVDDHPNNYQSMVRYARLAIEAADYDTAEKVLLELRQLHPDDRDGSGTLALLGLLYRKTEQPEKELEALSELARLSDRGLEVYARLIELHQANGDWESVRENAARYLSVQPILPFGHEWLGKAAEQLGRPDELAQSLTALLEMDPVDPAEVHFQIAKAHQESGNRRDARRQVLMALEYAPRYREAQRLLLTLVKGDGQDATGNGDAESDVDDFDSVAETDALAVLAESDVEPDEASVDQAESNAEPDEADDPVSETGDN